MRCNVIDSNSQRSGSSSTTKTVGFGIAYCSVPAISRRNRSEAGHLKREPVM